MKRASQFALGLLLAVAMQGAAAQTATVMTDQADYAPGTIVTITGAGWQPGETVTLSFVESPLIDTHPDLYATADANGNISNNQFSPDQHDVNITFTLSATGQTSGLQAQTTFTDANNTTVSGSVTNGSSGVQGITFTAYADSSLTTLEGGSANPVTSNASGSWTLTLNKDTNVVYVVATSASYNFTSLTVGSSGAIKDSNSEFHFANSNNGQSTTGIALTVTPKTSTTTAVASNNNPSNYGTSVTFTATVTPSSPTPTGNVSFYDGGTCSSPGAQIGTQQTLSSGTGSVSTSTLSAGSHNILACYAGDSTYAPSSGTVSQTVKTTSARRGQTIIAGVFRKAHTVGISGEGL